MIFLTVGTQFPFDRLVKTVDEVAGEGVLDEEIFGQIGKTSYKPQHFQYTDYLDKAEFDKCIERCSGIISHAGIGSIVMALDNDKPLLAMPRLRRYHEAVNDHQVDICEKFEELGHMLVAHNAEDLRERIKQLKSFVPQKRNTQVDAVIGRINVFLNELTEQKKRKH